MKLKLFVVNVMVKEKYLNVLVQKMMVIIICVIIAEGKVELNYKYIKE